MNYNVELAAKSDVLKTASALITQRVFEGRPLDDRVWVVSTALTIIGFVAYHIMIASWFRSESHFSGSAKVAVDDAARFGTMFVVSQIMSGNSLSDPNWIRDSGLFIASIVLYDLLFHNVVSGKLGEIQLDSGVKGALGDAIKIASVFSINNFAKGGEFDNTWMMSTGGFITGLAIYNIVVEKYTKGKF